MLQVTCSSLLSFACIRNCLLQRLAAITPSIDIQEEDDELSIVPLQSLPVFELAPPIYPHIDGDSLFYQYIKSMKQLIRTSSSSITNKDEKQSEHKQNGISSFVSPFAASQILASKTHYEKVQVQLQTAEHAVQVNTVILLVIYGLFA